MNSAVDLWSPYLPKNVAEEKATMVVNRLLHEHYVREMALLAKARQRLEEKFEEE